MAKDDREIKVVQGDPKEAAAQINTLLTQGFAVLQLTTNVVDVVVEYGKEDKWIKAHETVCYMYKVVAQSPIQTVAPIPGLGGTGGRAG